MGKDTTKIDDNTLQVTETIVSLVSKETLLAQQKSVATLILKFQEQLADINAQLDKLK